MQLNKIGSLMLCTALAAYASDRDESDKIPATTIVRPMPRRVILNVGNATIYRNANHTLSYECGRIKIKGEELLMTVRVENRTIQPTLVHREFIWLVDMDTNWHEIANIVNSFYFPLNDPDAVINILCAIPASSPEENVTG